MFEKNIIITGKHATYLKFLSSKTELLNKSAKVAGVFERNIDLLMIAPLFGLLYNRKADEDKTVEDRTNILAEQLLREKIKLDFVYRLINLADNSKGLTSDEKIDLVFRENGDENLFFQYVRGGLEYLYEFFSDNTTTKMDYYEKMVELVNGFNDEFIDETSYEERLKNLNI